MESAGHQVARRCGGARVHAVVVMVLVGALGFPFLSACAASGTDALIGTTWYLVSGGERTPAWEWTVPAEKQGRYTIQLEKDGSFTAQADCNQAAGKWEARGSDRLTITPGPMTMALCGERSLDVLYTGTLGQVRAWNVASTGMSLTLADGGRLDYTSVAPASPSATPEETTEPPATSTPTPVPTVTATVTATATATTTATTTATAPTPRPSPTTTSPTARPTPTPTSPPTSSPTKSPSPTPTPPVVPDITGRTWRLSEFTLVTPSVQGTVPPEKRDAYTIEFRADQTFTARADCNTLRGTYSTGDATPTGASISLSPGPATIIACEEGSYGDLYLTGLENVSALTLEAGRLTLALVDNGKLAYQ